MALPLILLVEDNPVTRKVASVALEGTGFQVVEAPDGETALRLAAERPPSLILQDLILPDINVTQLVERLRLLPDCSKVPIIAFSGSWVSIERARVSRIGFSDFLLKPVEPYTLIETVQTHLAPKGPGTSGRGMGRKLIVADDDPAQLKLAATYLELEGFRVTTASDGVEALNLARRLRPDAIVSDILMPKLDGFGLCLVMREDPKLMTIPVVLTTKTYLVGRDFDLAKKMGASAVVVRTSDFAEIVGAAVAAVNGELPIPVEAPVRALRGEHAYRLIRQVERQALLNAALGERYGSLVGALSVLSTISDSLAGSVGSREALERVVTDCLEAGGFSMGALYLADEGENLELRVHRGCNGPGQEVLESFFGHEPLFRLGFESGEPIAIPSPEVPETVGRDLLKRSGTASAYLVPVGLRDQRIGLLFVGAIVRDQESEAASWAFARTVASQIGEAIALSRAFSRLRDSEERYRSLFDRIPVGVYRAAPDGRVLAANPALVEMLGYPDRETLLSADFTHFYVSPEDRLRWEERIDREGVVCDFEMRLKKYDGQVLWVRNSARAIRGSDGEIVCYEGITQDVTEHKQIEEMPRPPSAGRRS